MLPFSPMPAISSETDFLIIGAGVAGLRAAIELAPAGRVLVLAKREVTESSTQFAQGGIAAALSDEDEISLHLQDTLNAGDGLCHPLAAQVLVEVVAKPEAAPSPIPRVQQKARNSAQPLTTALPGRHRSALVCAPATRPIASHRNRARAALLSVPEYLGECSQPRAPPTSLHSS